MWAITWVTMINLCIYLARQLQKTTYLRYIKHVVCYEHNTTLGCDNKLIVINNNFARLTVRRAVYSKPRDLDSSANIVLNFRARAVYSKPRDLDSSANRVLLILLFFGTNLDCFVTCILGKRLSHQLTIPWPTRNWKSVCKKDGPADSSALPIGHRVKPRDIYLLI